MSHLFGSDSSLCFAGKSAKARLGRRIEITGDPHLGWRLVRLLKRLDQQISRCIDPVNNPLITVKGLGPVITTGLLAEIVDISRFPEHKHLAQYFGISWIKRSSAGFVSQNTPMTKVGNPYCRYYFVIVADKLRLFNLEYKAFYRRKYNQASKHQHKRALVLTARKLVRLVHALLTKNVPYVRPRMTVDLEADLLQQVTLSVSWCYLTFQSHNLT